LILTVTPDPVLDRIFFIEEWKPGKLMKAYRTTTSVGGKGLDASVALSHLGQETTALAFLAGETGASLAELVKSYGIQLEAVWAGGETRTAHLIAEALHNRHSHLFSGGLSITRTQLEEFQQHFQRYLGQVDWVICGGILPPDLPDHFYGTLIQAAQEQGIPALIDCFGAFMHGALPARPEVVKLNRHEFVQTFDLPSGDLDLLAVQMEAVYVTHQINNLVVTCGAEGILARTDGGLLHAVPPALQAVNAAGAGDAASGVIAWRRALGDGWLETFHWAAAVSAAVVLTEGTGDCRQEDIQEIYPQVHTRWL
jgi:1-phosphofructokinase family hexose kinase